MNLEKGTPHGWDAINGVLKSLYGASEPQHFSCEPLQRLSVYALEAPIPHWHFITYGFTELYDGTTQDEEFSGFGFELTFRLKRNPGEDQPPAWTVVFFQNLARSVFQTKSIFEASHYLNAKGPIAPGHDTLLHSVMFAPDPALTKVLETPNGKLEFVQVVGITNDEAMAIKKWNSAGVHEVLDDYLPLLITDLARPSLLSDPNVAKLLEEGAKKEGSQTGMFFMDKLAWTCVSPTELKLSMGAAIIEELTAILPYRLPFDRNITLASSERQTVLSHGTANGFVALDKDLDVQLTAATLMELVEILKPVTGIYEIKTWPGLKLEIVKSEIRDAAGNLIKTVC